MSGRILHNLICALFCPVGGGGGGGGMTSGLLVIFLKAVTTYWYWIFLVRPVFGFLYVR